MADQCESDIEAALAEATVARDEFGAAAQAILDVAEGLLAESSEDPAGLKAKMQAAAHALLEACGYQDIVGQRLAKISRLIAGGATTREGPPLHGPGLKGPTVSQAEIDTLFG